MEEDAYKPDGPFYKRPGWQQSGDAASSASFVTGRSLGYTGGTSLLRPRPIWDMTTDLVGPLGALNALRERTRHGGSYYVLRPEIGFYAPEVVQKCYQTFQWVTIEPSQYVSELLMVVLDSWKKGLSRVFCCLFPIALYLWESHWGYLYAAAQPSFWARRSISDASLDHSVCAALLF